MMTWHGSTIACLAVCLMLASTSVMAADESSVDPCTLVTTAEVEQIIGKLKGNPTSNREERDKVFHL